MRLGPAHTPGGPVPVGGSTLVTGGAVSADGTVAALRTYTDVYLYSAPDGNLVRALTTTTPVRVALPNQPQGEAIAFTPDGTCWPDRNPRAEPCPAADPAWCGRHRRDDSGSGGSVPLSASVNESAAEGASGGAAEEDGALRWSTPALVGGALVAGLATYGLVRRRSRSRRH
ncbi:hypothetical protein P9209_21400 [Prescottella defluvii]|nr:hypothetical protein P9209_21400 [Prescottella defluvii]